MPMWEVEYTDRFDDWYQTLTEEEQDAVVARVELLESGGPALGHPVVDNVHQSRHPNMRNSERNERFEFCSLSIPAVPPSS